MLSHGSFQTYPQLITRLMSHYMLFQDSFQTYPQLTTGLMSAGLRQGALKNFGLPHIVASRVRKINNQHI